jgi:hypothetical protein
VTVQQNTPEWLALRAGKFTASRFADLLAFGRKDRKPLKARTDYIGEVVAELLTGLPREQARAKPLDWGHDVEAAARAAYEAETGLLVETTGFAMHAALPFVGCSPDFLVGDAGIGQIKCPYNPAVHVETLRNGMPEEHVAQVQGELWVTGRAWSDFISYDPRMPAHRRLYVQRIEADKAFHDQLEAAAVSAWAEVQAILEYLNEGAAA